eukprot:CAMPEP_0202948722 /NCGR_PEP_ID=MMETSP1395-20130829/14407_1 /ASSEMBLY_ACC=CAM_ASM_000871 /TAXON_ID=5961 /ORGANISM="Blepharisma japonicum, Strain Stock R1072" /LENGTH=421 /DNA_ID=CAMNT_0049651065 /DNA_START=27 /DNA_END=1292 /DNA_ORIENTATION=+
MAQKIVQQAPSNQPNIAPPIKSGKKIDVGKFEENLKSKQADKEKKTFQTGVSIEERKKSLSHQNTDKTQESHQKSEFQTGISVRERAQTLFQNQEKSKIAGVDIEGIQPIAHRKASLYTKQNTIGEEKKVSISTGVSVQERMNSLLEGNKESEKEKKSLTHTNTIPIAERMSMLNAKQEAPANKDIKIESTMTLKERVALFQAPKEEATTKRTIDEPIPALKERIEKLTNKEADVKKNESLNLEGGISLKERIEMLNKKDENNKKSEAPAVNIGIGGMSVKERQEMLLKKEEPAKVRAPIETGWSMDSKFQKDSDSSSGDEKEEEEEQPKEEQKKSVSASLMDKYAKKSINKGNKEESVKTDMIVNTPQIHPIEENNEDILKDLYDNEEKLSGSGLDMRTSLERPTIKRTSLSRHEQDYEF